MRLLSKYASVVLLIVASTFSLSVQAAPYQGNVGRWYTTEIIIIRNNEFKYPGNESWPIKVKAPDIQFPMYLVNRQTLRSLGGDTRSVLVTLSPAAFSLKDVEQRLQVSPKFDVLMHIAWRQPMPARGKGRPVILRSKIGFPVTPEQMQVLQPPSHVQQRGLVPVIDGFVKIEISRYLHLHYELVYSEPNPNYDADAAQNFMQNNMEQGFTDASSPAPTNDPLQTSAEDNQLVRQQQDLTKTTSMANTLSPLLQYKMVANRRMRSKEIHYIDHPRFSIIMLMTPYKPDSGT